MDENGTGMASPSDTQPSGAVTSQEATRKKPIQGSFRSKITTPRPPTKIDINSHGIRRETTLGPKKNNRSKNK